ncbi:MAG: hypothetical protein ACXVQU_08600 [Actinomycetota bacterium]
MGQATDRKLTEIEETRRRIEADLRELEARVPAPLRSVKSLAGMVLGSAVLTALAARLLGRKGSKERPAAEVVIRVVREDVSGTQRGKRRHDAS